jgi:hypothetical protein
MEIHCRISTRLDCGMGCVSGHLADFTGEVLIMHEHPTLPPNWTYVHTTKNGEEPCATTLAEFLLARIADEEWLAQDAASEGRPHRTGWQLWTSKKETVPPGVVLGPRGSVEASPARVLTECEVKREILKQHWRAVFTDVLLGLRDASVCAVCHHVWDEPSDWDEEADGEWHFPNVQMKFPCPTVKILALPYVDHPDFREEWRP